MIIKKYLIKKLVKGNKMKCLILFVFISLIILININLHAQWSSDPTVNTPICTIYNSQTSPEITSDDSSGAIMVWQDNRVGTHQDDIYAQRINYLGEVKWAADGVEICTASGLQSKPLIISDGAGGAIIAWTDSRSGIGTDIYAQKINSQGTVMWTADGIGVCTETDNQTLTDIISDDSNGVIIVWDDHRSGTNNDVYAQRIDGSGTALWTPGGVVVCSTSDDQSGAKIVEDGSNGGIFEWDDLRSGKYGIYAQKLNSSGAAQWTSNGVVIDTMGGNQFSALGADIASDDNGGAIITWADMRNGSDRNVFVQRINSSGTVQWLDNGVSICDAADDQQDIIIAKDSSGGAIISWMDNRNGSDYNIYAQKI